MALGRKTNFFRGKTKQTNKNIFLRKVGCSAQNHFFPKQKLVFHATTIFLLGKVGFSTQNHVFPTKKLAFHVKTIFSLGKSWFFCPKPFSS